MSTIIIIGGGGGGTNPTLAARGKDVVDGSGMTVATFNTPEDAIRYLRAVSAHKALGVSQSDED